MDLNLTPIEVRVLGALVEKEAATPDLYPLSLNALCAACNQRSSREPVMSLDEDTVVAALDDLRHRGLTTEVSGVSHRVPKYGHRLGEVFNFDRREQAVLCVLMLRGPQTVGELRGRSHRLYEFDDLDAVEGTLHHLAERTPPLVVELPRHPGEKEPRHAHLLSGEVDIPEPPAAMEPPAPMEPRAPVESRAVLESRLAQLEEEHAELRREFEEFRARFE